jgi:hypothetical protein
MPRFLNSEQNYEKRYKRYKLKKRLSESAALFQIRSGWLIQPASPEWWMAYKSFGSLNWE